MLYSRNSRILQSLSRELVRPFSTCKTTWGSVNRQEEMSTVANVRPSDNGEVYICIQEASQQTNLKSFLCSQLNRPTYALKEVSKVIRASPETCAEAYHLRAQIYSQMNLPLQSLYDLDKSLSINDANARAYLDRAQLLETRLNNYELALGDYTRAIELDSSLTDAYERRAYLYFQIDAFGKAIDDVNHLLSQLSEQDCAELYQFRSVLNRQLGNIHEAIQDLDKVLEIDPTNEVLFQRAKLYKSMNQNKKALKDLNKLVILDPKNVKYLTHRTVLLTQLGKHDKALIDAEKVLTMDPNSKVASMLKKALEDKLIQLVATRRM